MVPPIGFFTLGLMYIRLTVAVHNLSAQLNKKTLKENLQVMRLNDMRTCGCVCILSVHVKASKISFFPIILTFFTCKSFLIFME